jgi:hypothetical protein
MLCPHCNVESIPVSARFFTHYKSPVICPRCKGKSLPRSVWKWRASLGLLYVGFLAFTVLTPYRGDLGVVVTSLFFLCALMVVATSLPLAPLTEADALAAKRWELVGPVAGCLLAAAIVIQLATHSYLP